MLYIYTIQLICFLCTSKFSTGDPYYRHSYDKHRQLRTLPYYSEESGDSASYEPEFRRRRRCSKKYKTKNKCRCVTCCFKCPPKVEKCCEEKCEDDCQEDQDQGQDDVTQPNVILQPYPAPVMVPFPVMAPFPFGPYGPGPYGPGPYGPGPYGPGPYGPKKKDDGKDTDSDENGKDKNKDKDKDSDEKNKTTTRKQLPTIIPRECPGLAKCYSVNVDDFRRSVQNKVELITELPKYGLIKLPNDLDMSQMNALKNDLQDLKIRRTLML